MAAPTVSVIVPCYNLGAYLEEAIESVQAQTLQDYEILVVDDGSSDDFTRELLANAHWPHTQVFVTENRGLAAARNLLIAKSSGEYLCALDADDRLHPEFLERTVGVLRARPELAFVSTRLQMFGLEDREWPSTLRCDLPMLLAEDTVITAALVRKSAVLGVGGYDERMPSQGNEDWDLWISLVEAGHCGVILPETLFWYRRRSGSMSDDCTVGERHLDAVRYLYQKHRVGYDVHMTEVLLKKQDDLATLFSANRRIEEEVASIGSLIDLRRSELERLSAALDRVRRDRGQPGGSIAATGEIASVEPGELAAMKAECARSRSEVEELRRSGSWRITAPARACYDLLLKFRR